MLGHNNRPECLSMTLPHVQNCWWHRGKRSLAAAQHDKLLPLLASNKLPEISRSQFMNIFARAVIPPPMSMPHTHTHSKKMKGLLSSAFISQQITNLRCFKQMFCFLFFWPLSSFSCSRILKATTHSLHCTQSFLTHSSLKTAACLPPVCYYK